METVQNGFQCLPMLELLAFTDGACSGNPGPGGWGVVLQAKDGEKILRQRELNGGALQTTNNQMELTAAIEALETLTRNSNITIITDSVYVKDGITKWLSRWKQNGWRTAGKKPVKNLGLWRQLDTAQKRHSVTWQWVKGHAGHPGNERADFLARKGMELFKDRGAGAG